MTQLREQLQTALGDGYIVGRELGGGGMSHVFLVEDTRLGRTIVAKVLAPELTGAISVERFEREIRVAASLQQANIVPLLNAGDANGLPYFTMPYVEGESLRTRISAGRTFTIEECVSILRDIARALAFAHERGVVHRDIKPDNVLLSGDTAVVTDFGIAKALSASRTAGDSPTHAGLTQVGVSLGTPMYMAPEQAAADPDMDARADIYSFGCVAYELLAGRPPFTATSAQKLLAAHMSETPALVSTLRTDTPPALVALVMRCLEKDPAQRPQNAAELSRMVAVTGEGPASRAALPLLRAFAIWAAASAATFVLAKAAIVGIGLPDWVLPGAMLVATAGLPAIVATHWRNRTGRATSWRRTWMTGGVVGALFVLSVAGFMTLRAMGIGPAGSLLGRGVLRQNDRVVIAQFAARDTSLGGSVSDALRTELSQSKVVTVVQPSMVAQTLTTMGRADGTPVDASLAREVAQRTGAKAVITGEVSPLGAGFLIKARVIEPATGDPLATFQEIANDPADVLAAIGRISKSVRGKIGESLRTLQNLPPVERVTTASLQAFRKYNEAIQISEGTRGDPFRAIALLREAVTLDTTFAMAYRKLAWVEASSEQRAHWATKAWQHRARLTDVERYQAEGMYHWVAVNDLDAAIQDHLKAFDADSTVPRVAGNLTQLYSQKGEWSEALVWANRLARFDSAQGVLYRHPILMGLRRDADADRDLRAILAASSADDAYSSLLRINVAMARREWDSVSALTSGAARIVKFGPLIASSSTALNDLAHGRFRSALDNFESTRRNSQRLGLETPLNNVLVRGAIAGWYLADSARARVELDSVVRAREISDTLSGTEMLEVSEVYARSHLTMRAKEWLAKYERAVTDSLARRRNRDRHASARGWIALADGRAPDAVTHFRAQLEAESRCRLCARAALGMAHDRAGQVDSTLAIYQALLEDQDLLGADSFAPVWDALMLKRLGEILELRNNRQQALKHYRRFVELMKDADPELQHQVRDVRLRTARLERLENLRR